MMENAKDAGATSPQHKSLNVISVGVTNGPPPAVAEIASHDAVITAPWRHPAIHDEVPALPIHLVAGYQGVRGPGIWRNGRMQLEGNGRPGAISLVPAHHGGHWDIDGTAPISYVLLSDRRLREFADQSATRRRGFELLPRLGEADPIGAHILKFLARMAARPAQVQPMLLEQTLDLLCCHILRVHAADRRLPDAAAKRGLLPWQVRRVTAYMRGKLDQDISLDELAGLLNLSRFHFCTAFRLATGATPYEWLTQRRIERARELLAKGDLRVTDIALAVGYGTPSAFAASFRREMGVTPTVYRRSLLE